MNGIDSNPGNLNPVFWSKLQPAIEELQRFGFNIHIIEGKREPITQLLYFLQGRVGDYTGDNKNIVNEYMKLRQAVGLFSCTDSEARTKKITWTLDSRHFTGHAVDLGFIGPMPVGAWGKVAEVVERHGLVSGHRWAAPKQDSPHVEDKV